MILLCGIPSESPLALVREQLELLHIPYVLFNQRRFRDTELAFEIQDGRITGLMRVDGAAYRLEDFQGVYTRLMDDQVLPELKDEPQHSVMRQRSRSLHATLTHWTEITQARVVNRAAPQGSNFSKPYQGQIILDEGIRIPETLITNDPELVRSFQERHGRLIYKSISGIRSIVQSLEEKDLSRLGQIRWCPTQFQEFIEGTNVRVHVVGREVFATAVSTEAIDYRYAQQQVGDSAQLTAIELPAELAEKCVRLAARMGLAFAGIDLKITPDDRVYCFEVNPSPAFSYYEANTGQPIALALARYLAQQQN
ncbi:MAG TPA: ATP-grasp domain-containing protein [Pyrinomonadaceae bacterium]|jgi:glutathione synthase/RimK-type ligase-like ATP-grasp enzyme